MVIENFRFITSPLIEDRPELLLVEVERLFYELAKHKGDTIYMRMPPTIMRDKSFETHNTLAGLHCRWSVVKKHVATPISDLLNLGAQNDDSQQVG